MAKNADLSEILTVEWGPEVDTVLGAAMLVDVNVLLWGDMGIGKSAKVCGLESLGYLVEVVIASTREPADFSGLPMRNPVSNRVEMVPPGFAVRANEATDGKGIIFFDEISTAPPAVQAALLRVLNEGYVGDLKLNDSVRIIAAANPADTAANGFELSAPAANRFLHLHIKPSVDAFTSGMTVGWTKTDFRSLPLVFDPVLRAEREAEYKARVAAFINNRQDLLIKVPSSIVDQGGAFPTPRTWEWVAKMLAAISDEAEDARNYAVWGLVGHGAGSEFLTWEKNQDLPRPQDVLANPTNLQDGKLPKGYDWLDHRTDRAFAVLSSVTAYAVTHMTAETYKALWLVYAAAQNAGKGDAAAAVAGNIISLPSIQKLVPPKEAMALMELFRDMGKFTKKTLVNA